jgi:hypothetical protein
MLARVLSTSPGPKRLSPAHLDEGIRRPSSINFVVDGGTLVICC